MATPGCLLGWCLVALAATDLATFVLPDALTLPLAGAGLVLAEREVLADCLVGAVAGWAAFQAIGCLYRHLRGRDGLGGGDAKLMTAAGAWVGWQGLPTVDCRRRRHSPPPARRRDATAVRAIPVPGAVVHLERGADPCRMSNPSMPPWPMR